MNVWKIKTIEINVRRLIPATPAEVFDVWLNPESPGSPWHGMKRTILQPQVDGLFYTMHSSDGEEYELAHYGRFTIIDRPKRIQHTWVSQHTRGLESLVTLNMEKQGQQTLITLLHGNLPDDEMGRMHELGWKHHLESFAGQFERRQ